ncbi:MAG: TonB-dependent receptor [Luteibacter sp.]|uniref:TonB-dependent receptor n=1 Tax=unclassified Luteibacter TaxID=2620188 RepID=UPI0005BC0DD8|nr:MULTISPECIES: TonB-dependent receptor [unclassified Luteibacter]MDQ7998078.1 TonB-dependent receptor [Luteibacter sp.]MDQ8050180.1 TonB-dependent receptor [Luteibacter sp.]MDR6644614.1 outer membrane receptor for ferrienterochelin and colicin [Luteibacter sp. 1214]
MNSRHNRAAMLGRRTALALAIGLGTVSGAAFAQSTTGSIFGQVPAGAGQTVTATNETGVSRTVNVDAAGRYSITSLPLGSYKVTLNKDGAAVDSRSNVSLRVGAGTEVAFDAAASATAASSLEGVTVSANALPSIDVSAVDSRTVITSEQLSKLPLARTAEAIALLAPGAVAGSSFFTGPTGNPLVSIAGSAVTENAYYINGFNTTDPLSGFGGITLPYGAIDQQEILAGGYGAAYGRSSGGVISQVGKRGTNEWHFGAQVLWEPNGTKANQINYYRQVGAQAGQLYDDNKKDKLDRTTYSVYAGGPLIKDTLYVFVAAEQERRSGEQTTSVAAPFVYKQSYRNPKFYGKVDWNITDSNILEITGASNKQDYDASIYEYDYPTKTRGDYVGKDNSVNNKSGADLYSAKFTSYITDDLTLTALYGKMKGTYYTATGGDQSLPSILTATNQDPLLNGGNPITNANPSATTADPKHTSTNTNFRVDLSYHIGDHTIVAGIDNQKVLDKNDGDSTTGPGYAWEYNKTDAGTPIIGEAPTDASYVAPPGGRGYYVARYVYGTAASVRTTQRAQYIEDTWQVNDRWMVKVGLRNDQFTNYNQDGEPYLRLTTPQWAPRLGATWDVNGDSSLKIYANAGRYYLALPATVALRSAGASLYTREYFNYTGIDANGIPQGLTPIFSSTGGPISANSEYGIPRDPKTAAATNIKSEYQDEFILGFDAALTDKWTYGAKATVRKLRNAIDDVGDSGAILRKMERSGIDPDTIGDIQGSYLFNPGRANTFLIPNTNGGYYSVDMNNEDFGFPHSKRNYYGLELYLDHAWDGKYQVRFDYVYSKSYGNSEGQVRSDIRQDNVSATVDWDYAEVMQYSNGELANSRKHNFKIYGSYQLASEWLVSGNINIASGAPRSCLGFYGPNETNPNLGYGSYYHWCDGQPSPPGEAGHNPWTYIVTGSVEYRPEWADKKLAFNVTVFNLLNQRKETQVYPIHGSAASLNPRYDVPLYQTQPRYARFGITYDF